jgi:hypothetical protein
VAPLSAQRLLKLATNCSQGAAVSSRLELYPQKMAAQRAIRIAMGSLIGPRVLTEAQVRERILGRYPEAEDLPPRPALDGMLTEAGSDLVWRQDGADGPGYYPSHKGFGPSAGTTTFLHRTGTFADDKNEVTEEEAAARQFEEKLNHAVKAGGFLALTVAPRLTRHAEAALQRILSGTDFQSISLDQLILQSLKEEAALRKVDWAKVIEADIAGPGSRDWINVIRLASFAKARIKGKLTAEHKSMLLLHPGLLARLDLMDLVSDLQNVAGSATGIPSVWMLAPMAGQGLPTLDGVAIPVITQAQWARIPSSWISATATLGR